MLFSDLFEKTSKKQAKQVKRKIVDKYALSAFTHILFYLFVCNFFFVLFSVFKRFCTRHGILLFCNPFDFFQSYFLGSYW